MMPLPEPCIAALARDSVLGVAMRDRLDKPLLLVGQEVAHDPLLLFRFDDLVHWVRRNQFETFGLSENRLNGVKTAADGAVFDAGLPLLRNPTRDVQVFNLRQRQIEERELEAGHFLLQVCRTLGLRYL